jgi:hypothetical protein
MLLSLCMLTIANAQVKKAQSERTLKKVMEIAMPGESGGQDGTRGAGVAYNPVTKKYYAAFAGNVSYPLSVFDTKGKILSGEDLKTNADLRGFWYNPTTKTLQANCYDIGGWVSYKLDSKGMPQEPTKLLEGMYQPEAQSMGVFDAKTKTVYFLKGNTVIAYDLKGNEGKSISLVLKDNEGEDFLPEKYNYSTIIYTGIPKQEFGIYDTENKKIELYSKATGKLTASWLLPNDLPTQEVTNFNFSFCNGMVWLYDIDSRKWYAYK